MLTSPPSVKLWYAPGVDLRLGFDGLAALVRARLHADPLAGHLFIFTNRTADRVKVLYWGGHGLCLWSQRLEAGRYHFPGATPAGIELTASQFLMILDGIDLSRVRRFKRYPPIGLKNSRDLARSAVFDPAWTPSTSASTPPSRTMPPPSSGWSGSCSPRSPG